MTSKRECPFCGGSLYTFNSDDMNFVGPGHRAKCMACAAQGPQMETATDALHAFCHPAQGLDAGTGGKPCA